MNATLAPSSLGRCATCTPVTAQAEDTYWTVGGSNEVLCNGHAAQVEAHRPEVTFKLTTPEAAWYLTTGA